MLSPSWQAQLRIRSACAPQSPAPAPAPPACRYHEVYRRHNYTTPKSYLELISLYKQLLASKREQLAQAKQRLESGVDKITLVGLGLPLAGCGLKGQQLAAYQLTNGDNVGHYCEWVETEGWMDGEMLEQPSQAAC